MAPTRSGGSSKAETATNKVGEDETNGGDSSAGLSNVVSSSVAQLPKTAIVHPLVLLSAVDHFNRVSKETKKRVVGLLLGARKGGNLDISNSFAGMWSIEEEKIKKRKKKKNFWNKKKKK